MILGKLVTQAVLVVFGAGLAGCSPLAPVVPTTNKVSSMANITTTNGTLDDDIRPMRAEIGQALCGHQYLFFHEEWIAQVPKLWWKYDVRWNGNAELACSSWMNALRSSRTVCGLRVTECWEMKKNYPSGGIGWLHARMTTCIGPTWNAFVLSYRIFDRSKEFHDLACPPGIGV